MLVIFILNWKRKFHENNVRPTNHVLLRPRHRRKQRENFAFSKLMVKLIQLSNLSQIDIMRNELSLYGWEMKGASACAVRVVGSINKHK